MIHGERILEEENGDDQAKKLAKCDNKCDRERAEFRGEDKHTSNTNELRDTITEQEEPHTRNAQPQKKQRLWEKQLKKKLLHYAMTMILIKCICPLDRIDWLRQ